jgi:hypothetical protein
MFEAPDPVMFAAKINLLLQFFFAKRMSPKRFEP